MDAWLGIIGAVVGATLGWLLSEMSSAVAARKHAVLRLQQAAFVCLDRLLKIKNFHDHNDQPKRDGEIYHLGGDLDKYRDAIAAGSRKGKAHWRLYRRTMPLLLDHDMRDLDGLIRAYEDVAG